MEKSLVKRDANNLQGINFVDEFIKQKYLDEAINRNSEMTYRRALKQLQKFMDDNCYQLKDLDLDKMQLWKESLRQRVAVGTMNLYIVVVKSFFRFLDSKYFPNNLHEIKTVKADRKTHKKTYIRFEWFEKMLDEIPGDTLTGKRSRAIMCLKAFSGLRDIEITRLTHEDFKYISGQYRLTIQGKGRQEKEIIGVPAPAVKTVVAYQKALQQEHGYNSEDPLFISFSNNSFGHSLSTASIRSMLARLIDTLDISPDDRDRLSGHSLRHSFVTWQLLAGEDIRTVQIRARHSDSKTTEIYAHDLDTEKTWDNLEGVFKPLYDRIKTKITETFEDVKQSKEWETTPSFVYS